MIKLTLAGAAGILLHCSRHPPKLPKTKAYQTERPPIAFHTALRGVCALLTKLLVFLHRKVKGNFTAQATEKIRNLKNSQMGVSCVLLAEIKITEPS